MTTAENKEKMRRHLAARALIRTAGIKLSGGGTASYYFDCKRVTLDGAFLALLSDWLLDDVAPAVSPSPTVLGGPAIGADFIVAAAAMRAHQRGLPLTAGVIARKEIKKHGTQNRLENEPDSPARVLVVEDVITTGGSIARACDEYIAGGHTIAAIAVIIDRLAGGREALEEKYQAPVYALFNTDDFPELAE